MLIVGSLVVLAAAVALLALGVDPLPGWFYLFAWYPTLVLFDALARRADGRPLALSNRPAMLSVWLWSAPVWLFFELANFRLQNWYYVFVPRGTAQRWAGMLLAFATVLPALFLAERLLHAHGVGKTWEREPVDMGRGGLVASLALGVAQLILAMVWPEYFFPVIWGALFFLCEPYVYRKRPDLSLLNDVANGEWGRIGRLLIGGAAVGLLWETFNFWSRAKWIYTVPGLENIKLYEMPILGFLGFPFFALEAWAVYHALCAAGVAIPLGERQPARPGRTVIAAGLAAFLSFAILRGIDRQTVSSTVPHLQDHTGITTAELASLRSAGIDSPFQLAEADPRDLSRRFEWTEQRARSLVGFARLATLRGIGSVHAYWLGVVGVSSVCDLARTDPERVWLLLQPITRENELRPTPAETRVWQQAAARACVRR